MTQQQIYRGPVNIERPEASYDLQGQFMTYYFPEPTYGYDQFGNPQYGSNQVDPTTGNLIPQYNKPYAPRYNASGMYIEGTGSTSEGVMTPSLTGQAIGGQTIVGLDPNTGQPIYGTTTGQAGDPMFQSGFPQSNDPSFYAPPPPPTSRFVENIGQGATSGVSRNDLMGRARVSASEPLAFGNPAMGGRSENIVRSSRRNPNLDIGFPGGRITERRPDSRSGQMGDARPKPKVDPRDRDLRRGTLASSGEGGN